MDAKELFEKLKSFQEKQGCFFNPDETYTMPLLESLLENKERFGYMACPCRLACGKYELDKDIICPCTYREPDMEEFGMCFCALYVSQEWLDGQKDREEIVPDRRPPEKIMEGLLAIEDDPTIGPSC